MLNQENQSMLMKEIIETHTKAGISLSDGAMKELEKSCIKVADFSRIIVEKISSGMNENEAMDWYLSQMSDKEKSQFMADLNLVLKYEAIKRHLREKD